MLLTYGSTMFQQVAEQLNLLMRGGGKVAVATFRGMDGVTAVGIDGDKGLPQTGARGNYGNRAMRVGLAVIQRAEIIAVR